MLRRLLATALLCLGLTGCAWLGRGEESGAELGAVSPAEAVTIKPAAGVEWDMAHQVTHAVWGVVPNPPSLAHDFKPEMIRGSAVAVGPATLLASCRIVSDRRQLVVTQYNQYARADLVAADPVSSICTLRVPDGVALTPVTSWRSIEALREGQPVFVLVSRSPYDLIVAHGQLIVKHEDGGWLETTLPLPVYALSAVLFDDAGHLIGLGSAGLTADSLTMAAALPDGLIPSARRNIEALIATE